MGPRRRGDGCARGVRAARADSRAVDDDAAIAVELDVDHLDDEHEHDDDVDHQHHDDDHDDDHGAEHHTKRPRVMHVVV